MASSNCSVTGCKREFDTLCAHCQRNFCTKHYIEHAKLAYDELIPLADQLNTIINSLKQQDPLQEAFQQLEQSREKSHQHIDQLYSDRKKQLQAIVQEKVEKQINKLCKLSEQVKGLLHEGDASFKQIEKIKRDIEQCKQVEKNDYLRLNLKPIQIEARFVGSEFFIGGTLLSREQEVKLNEFYGGKDQKWLLIYKATYDGFGASDFHRCCDNQGPTITVIQSKNNGFLFGGYTSVSWESVGNYVTDNNNPFIFTLTNPHGIPPTRYSIQKTQYSIYDHRQYGPTFGGGFDLGVCDNSQTTLDSYTYFPHSYIDTTNPGSGTFTGSEHFQTSDIEVYRLNTS